MQLPAIPNAVVVRLRAYTCIPIDQSLPVCKFSTGPLLPEARILGIAFRAVTGVAEVVEYYSMSTLRFNGFRVLHTSL